jgi:hypothetical protein
MRAAKGKRPKLPFTALGLAALIAVFVLLVFGAPAF